MSLCSVWLVPLVLKAFYCRSLCGDSLKWKARFVLETDVFFSLSNSLLCLTKGYESVFREWPQCDAKYTGLLHE